MCLTVSLYTLSNQYKCVPIIALSVLIDCVDGDYYRHAKFWILAFPYGLANGVYNSWGSVLDVNLSPIGIQQVASSSRFYVTS